MKCRAREVLEDGESESVIKIMLVPFFHTPGTIFTQNLKQLLVKPHQLHYVTIVYLIKFYYRIVIGHFCENFKIVKNPLTIVRCFEAISSNSFNLDERVIEGGGRFLGCFMESLYWWKIL